MKVRHILFTTDFSASARMAAGHALFLAQRHGATLHVLHVARPSDSASSLLEGYDHLASSIEVPDDVPLTRAQVQHRSAAQGILEYTRAQKIDLVVMGTHGRSGLRRVTLGSVAEAVVRGAPCPVLTVHLKQKQDDQAVILEKTKHVEYILAPVDFSTPSRRSLFYARALAEVYEARVDLLHVMSSDEAEADNEAGVIYEGPPGKANLKARLAAMARGARLKAGVHVIAGRLPASILDFAEREGVDLMVVGTHGRKGLNRVLVGSVAEQIIRQAPCPVLTVKYVDPSSGRNGEEAPSGQATGEEGSSTI